MAWANPLVNSGDAIPYPGLQEFLKVRSLRDYHMDDCRDLDLQYL